MIQKWKNAKIWIGLGFTIAVGLFCFAMSWVAFSDAELFARLEPSLFDIGIDA